MNSPGWAPWQETLLHNIEACVSNSGTAKGVAEVLDAVIATLHRSRDSRTPLQISTMREHGVAWWAQPRGVSGDIHDLMKMPQGHGKPNIYLRNHICQLDGVEIDGCEYSDLDCDGVCIHCQTYVAEAEQWVT